MYRRILTFVFLSLLLAFCAKKKEQSDYAGTPVISVTDVSVADVSVTITFKSLNADAAYAMVLEAPVATEPAVSEIAEKGVKTGISTGQGNASGGQESTVTVDGLAPGRDYILYVVPTCGDVFGTIHSTPFTTTSLYPWESSRTEIPFFADLDLLPGGVTFKTPNTWDEDRILPHVTFTDENGQEHWLHEAFLFIGGEDAARNTTLCIVPTGARSAGKDSWEDFAAYWFAEGGVADVLDRTISNASARIGKPSFRHSVVVTMPDPIMLEYFSDKNSSTTYWGELYGRQLDFSDPADQILAYKWYIDHVRELWDAAAPENLDLAGFYILSEELVAKPSGWNYKYKRWDKILPSVSDYLHGMNYGLYWIPYYQASGYDMTDQLGIDCTWLQPNKYWDYPEKEQKKSWSWVFDTMDTYGHGMEIEFEGTHGEAGWSQYEEGVKRTSSSILEMLYTDTDLGSAGTPNPQAERNRQLLRDYMNEFKEAGCYGKARIATYSGTNAMYELATSPYPKDRAMYLEYCRFIVENPLRK